MKKKNKWKKNLINFFMLYMTSYYDTQIVPLPTALFYDAPQSMDYQNFTQI
jgi:hypothetical protein